MTFWPFRKPTLVKVTVPPPPEVPALRSGAREEAEQALAQAQASRAAVELNWRWVDVVSKRLKRYEDEDRFTELVERALRGKGP